MTDDLRARILAALREHQPPTHVDSEGLPPDEFECCADAVMAVLGEQFPPALALDLLGVEPRAGRGVADAVG